MVKRKSTQQVGHFAFLIGVLAALILGAASAYLGPSIVAGLTSLLVIAGLFVGYYGIHAKGLRDFLYFAIVLVIAAGMGSASTTLGSVLYLGVFLQGIFNNILAFVVPATVIGALRGVVQLTQ